MDAEMLESYHQARREAGEAKEKLLAAEKKYAALETLSRIRSEEASQMRTIADKKAAEAHHFKQLAKDLEKQKLEAEKRAKHADHFQRVAQESEKKRLEALKQVEEKQMKVSEGLQLVKTLQDDLSIEKKRSEELEHRLVESENSFPEQIAAYMGGAEYGQSLDESEVKLLRSFGAKLATKFPDQAVAMVAATEVFCGEYYDVTYPDGLPPLEDNILLRANLPAFDAFDPASL